MGAKKQRNVREKDDDPDDLMKKAATLTFDHLQVTCRQ
jgi:hypothetical protein